MKDYTISQELSLLEKFSKEVRHYLHTIPEASGEEYKTSAYCKKMMQSFGYSVVEYPGFTGFHADLNIADNIKRVAFRADMDGLEMPDLTESEYRSVHDNMAHNCGHDSHMAIALTAARFLAENQHALKCNVRFIFQMAEEDMRVPGAENG